jgi:hypothetical protein
MTLRVHMIPGLRLQAERAAQLEVEWNVYLSVLTHCNKI